MRFQVKDMGRKVLRMGAGLALLTILSATTATLSHAQVAISIADQTVEFSAESQTVIVDVVLANAAPLAGIDLVIGYSADDFLSAPTWENGDLFGLLDANPEFAAGQVKVAAASGSAIGTAEGVLVRLTFEVPCAGNAQAFPAGRELSFTISDSHLFDETLANLALDVTLGTLTVNCTATATENVSLGVLKAFFRPELEIR